MPVQKLIQTQKQTLKINPQQIQFLNFLQLNELEVEERIRQEIEENPLLEEEEENWDFDIKRVLPTNNADRTGAMTALENQRACSADLLAELKEQVKFASLSEREELLDLFILGSVDEKGFLKSTDEELEDIISFAGNVFYTKEEIAQSRARIQALEPKGVASDSLPNYILCQAEELGLGSLVRQIVTECFEELGERDFESLQNNLHVEQEELSEALQAIASLKPYPFFGFEVGTEFQEEILPEYKVEWRNGEVVAGILVGDKRRLQFNEAYLHSLEKGADKKTKAFLARKSHSAQWFMEALEERYKTMSACIAAVVRLQEAYFLSGNLGDLKPMILKDVAEITGRNISTISRVTSQKFVETPFGTVSMKSLFSEAIQKNNGEYISNREVQDFVSHLVENEDKNEPLTDAQIQVRLEESGVKLTRRTITKYRESLNILSSKYRRAL
ncbi:RNA polymerase factor sigma-54 [Marinilongibacter aquaticus]|uniref:RNA polymerase factor sigma-54 n=1 Tax=Marinilongibacter aquaticus TaxID=2975157 RepID=UPI0021BDDB73|nr:RNA polymerase factor sigma-54 [Marinilongibacter aquaticus]UBM60654.1 RNA polymerase factor sigma-54 [Marinilongibacter aquaticus]